MNGKTTPNFILCLKNGDPSAYYQLVEQYNMHVIDFLTTVLRSREDAEEIAQDIFIHIWKKRDTLVFGKQQDIKGYIFTLARTRAIDRLNERKRSRLYFTDELITPAEVANSPEDIIESRQLKMHIEKAMSAMPRMRRTIYSMRYVHGKSNEQIAKELNLKSSTVRAHISLAIKELRNSINP